MDYAEFRKKFGISEKQAAKKPPVNPDTDQNSSNGQDNENAENKINLAELSKTELLKFAIQKKLYDKSFKNKEPAEIIPVILEKARAKVVEADLKTAEEAASLEEAELFTLFDGVGKA